MFEAPRTPPPPTSSRNTGAPARRSGRLKPENQRPSLPSRWSKRRAHFHRSLLTVSPPALPPSPPSSLHLSPPPSWQPRGCFIVTFAFISFSPKAIPPEVYPTPNHQLPNCCCCLVAKSRPTLCGPMDRNPPGSSVHGICPGKNTGVGCHFFQQGIFPTQGSNSCLLCVPCIAGGPLTAEPPGKPKCDRDWQSLTAYSVWYPEGMLVSVDIKEDRKGRDLCFSSEMELRLFLKRTTICLYVFRCKESGLFWNTGGPCFDNTKYPWKPSHQESNYYLGQVHSYICTWAGFISVSEIIKRVVRLTKRSLGSTEWAKLLEIKQK